VGTLEVLDDQLKDEHERMLATMTGMMDSTEAKTETENA